MSDSPSQSGSPGQSETGSDPNPTSHLDAHRSVILLRSVLIGAATAAPAVGDFLVPALKRGLMQHVSGLWHLDIDDAAIEALLAENDKVHRLSMLTMVGGFLAVLHKTGRLRRLFVGFTILRGVEETSRAFHLATLLDHYCARHSVGATIHEREAKRLREIADAAVAAAQQQVAATFLQNAVEQGLRLLQAVPSWALAKVGRAPMEPPAPIPEVTQSARSLFRDLSARRYFANVLNSFDKKWREATP